MAEGIPGAQLVIPSLILTDITTSMTLLSRHTCQVATAYGYASKVPENLPHLIAAMAPQSESSDEGYLALKTAVITSIRESVHFMARTTGMVLDRHILEAARAIAEQLPTTRVVMFTRIASVSSSATFS